MNNGAEDVKRASAERGTKCEAARPGDQAAPKASRQRRWTLRCGLNLTVRTFFEDNSTIVTIQNMVKTFSALQTP